MTREEQLFAEALDLPPEQRAAHLARVCAGDPALLRRLEELLRAYADSERLFNAALLPPRPVISEEKLGDTIGRYTLIRRLGEGGCGTVYLAEQREPVIRQVALKIVKLGMDTREVIARFEAERQALAMMEHPHIARVFDAGATETGRPFFVMEFVDGVPITTFCDTHHLAVPARLSLFVQLCQALQHAHQKGIIHRDLKPSNILVALQDGVPTPRIIDFGIAKATQGRLTAHTLLTRCEQIIGTPAYMSPEQADLRETDIDTRSDIYSLGVLLYELLTGRPPFDSRSLLEAGVAEIRRILRETEPPRPSTVVSTLGDAARTKVAQHRRASPNRLPYDLRGDLDWIVMRCLEKQRDRRYGTAAELGDDIRRHLNREPVIARPPSAWYRTRKFVSRHRFACASAAALALAIVGGAGAATWQAVRATRAEHAARLAQTDAQRRQGEAEELLTFMLGDFRAELAKIGRLKLLDAVGDRASAYFAALDPRDQTDTTLLRHAKALTQIGEIRLDEGRFADAQHHFLTAHQRAAPLVDRHPRNAEMLFARAQAEFWLGVTHRKQGDLPAANRWLTAYRDSGLGLVALEPNRPEWQEELGYGHHNLAVLAMDQGDYETARRGFGAELDLLVRPTASASGARSPTLRYNIANLHSWLGSAAEWSGDFAEARARYAEQASKLEALVAAEPDNARWRVRLTDAYSFAADLALRSDRLSEAEDANRRARELIASLSASDPSNRTWQGQHLRTRLVQAELQLLAGNPSAALAATEQVRPDIERLAEAEPSSRDFSVLLIKAWRGEAECLLALGLPAADSAAEQAVRLGRQLADSARLNEVGLSELLAACATAAEIHERAGAGPRAEALHREILQRLGPRLATSRDWRLLDPAARALAGLGRTEEARDIVLRLTGMGYRPPHAWAAPLRP